MTDKVFARPVIPLLFAFIVGIAAGLGVSGLDGWAYLLVAASTIAICTGLIQNKTARTLPIMLFLSLGYLAIQPWAAPNFSANHVMRFIDSGPCKISGTVDSQPVIYPHRVRFVLDVEAIEAATAGPVYGRIVVSVWGDGPILSSGDRVAFTGAIRAFRNFNNPGRFDYRRYMNFNHIWGAAHVQAKGLQILNGNPAPPVRVDIKTARNRISELIDKTGEGEHQGVLKALIIGERGHISDEMITAFNRAGVSHLLAISGLHVGIVATAAFAFFQWLLQWIRPLLWRAWTRKGAALLTLIPVLIYGLLAGMSPSTQRAVIMVAVFLLTFLLETDQDLINTLAVAAMAILTIYPPALFSISFQLSFSAVFFIVCGLAGTQRGHQRPGLFRKLFIFIMVSFLAVLGTLPLVMFYFNQVSLVGLLSNLVLIPLIGFVVVPLSLTAVFIYPISPAGALWCLKAGAGILNPSLDIVKFFAGLPFAAIKTITPNYVEIACYYGLAGLLFYWRQDRLRKAIDPVGHPQPSERDASAEEEPDGPVHRTAGAGSRIRNRVYRFCQRMPLKKHLAAMAAGVLLLAAGVDAGYWYYQRLLHPALRVTVIDVGQGNAALLELPKGYTMLVDGGGFSDNSSFDVGAQVVAPLLWRKKIKTIDALVLSHPNSDHLNGLLYIAEHFNVKEIWANGQPAAIRSYERFLEIIQKNNIRMPGFDTLARNREINGVRLNIIYPLPKFFEKSAAEKWRNLNNNSLVVQVRFGAKTILFTGDIMAPAEAELVSATGATLAGDVLVSPHHGSAKSNSDVFLDAVSPKVVIVSAGWKNRFHFPHESVLEKYHRRGYRLFRTDTDGAVFITTDGTDLEIRPFLTHNS
ncbi:MAG: ComEC/Rec2 family competence protein [Desulfobacterales bacterium]|nr:ComEC/Rec2 family competence protein [Desulfobacterales bacterium]